MKPLLVLLAAGAIAAAVPVVRTVGGQDARALPADRHAENQIRELEAAVNRAVVAADAEFFDRALASDFTHTSHSGRFRGKTQWMADMRQRRTKYATFESDDLAIRVFGNTAVVTGRSTPTGTDSKGEPIGGRYRFLRVWVKLDGRWQAVAFEGTRIATD